MSKTVNSVMDAALRAIGEAPVTALTADDILQEALLGEMSNRVNIVMGRARYRWGLKRTTFKTKADITTGTVSATNASTTVTSLDDDGVAADNFGSVTTDMTIRIGTDLDSYKVSAVTTTASPDTLTLETTYIGTTTTTSAYVIFQDTYDLTDSDLGEVRLMQYGQGRTYIGGMRGLLGSTEIDIVDLETISSYAGGDLHRDTSGRPICAAQVINDADHYQRWLLWPYPADEYLIEVWYQPKFSALTALATSLFGGDAPDLAHDYVEYGCCERACLFDNDPQGAAYWAGRAQQAMAGLTAYENRTYRGDNAMSVETFRTRRWMGMKVTSQYAFDHKSGVRR